MRPDLSITENNAYANHANPAVKPERQRTSCFSKSDLQLLKWNVLHDKCNIVRNKYETELLRNVAQLLCNVTESLRNVVKLLRNVTHLLRNVVKLSYNVMLSLRNVAYLLYESMLHHHRTKNDESNVQPFALFGHNLQQSAIQHNKHVFELLTLQPNREAQGFAPAENRQSRRERITHRWPLYLAAMLRGPFVFAGPAGIANTCMLHSR